MPEVTIDAIKLAKYWLEIIPYPSENQKANPSIIEHLFASYPNADIGLPTGQIKRISVVDVDTKNDVDGHKTIDQLV